MFEQRGIVQWRRLPLGLMLQLVPVLLLGGILAACRANDFYVLIFVPVFVVIIPAMLSGAIAGWMRWRQPQIAGTVGFALGSLAYLAQFYVLMVYFRGVNAVWRVDVVPFLILQLMQTQAISDEGVNVAKNWGYLIVEVCIAGGAFAIGHVMVAGNLYCPVCAAPIKKKSSILPPDFATALAIGIAENQLDDLPLDTSGGEIEGDAWSNVEVLYCFHKQADAEPVFYLTLCETRYEGGVGFKSVVFDKVLLSAEEMVAIGEKCPGLVISPGSATAKSTGADDAESGESTD